MGKEKSDIPPLLLALVAAVLLTCGWLLASFPWLIFVGISPLMALAEPDEKPSASILEKMELVLIALTVPLFIYAWAVGNSVITAIVVGMLFTLAFVAHAWTRQVLGIRSGKITLLLYWLSAEYLILKLAPEQGIFLADSLRLEGDWLLWTRHTGYLGATAWVLLVNGCMFYAFLQGKATQWGWFWAAMVVFAGPFIYSFTLDNSPITREEMINLYTNKTIEADVVYLARGELVVRTATWLSALILLFTFVRQQTRK